MGKRSLENWKEEYNIIKCEMCGCDVKTTHALRKYCYTCRCERNRISKEEKNNDMEKQRRKRTI